MTSREFQERLAAQAKQANLSLSTELAESLELYFGVLAQWNRTINLTGLNLDGAHPDALDRLLIEPVLAARYVTTPITRLIDIGSGGGSPAIPMALALARPELLMVESKSRKSVFLREAVRSLGLRNATVANSRYESLLEDATLGEQFDVLTIRAVRVSTDVLNDLQRFVRPNGHLILFRSEGGEPLALPGSVRPATSHKLVHTLDSRVDVFEKT